MNYGYTLRFNEDSYNAKFDICILTQYDKGGKWLEIANWRWYPYSGTGYWHGGTFSQEMYVNDHFRFEAFLKFAGKVMRNNMFAANIEDVITWLTAQKLPELVYDMRLGEWLTLATYKKTAAMSAYKIITNDTGDYLDDVLAYDESDALRTYVKNATVYALKAGVHAIKKQVDYVTYVPDLTYILNFAKNY